MALCLGSPTSDKAVWGHSPDKPVWRDVIPDETEVAPGRDWPSNDICKTRRFGGDRDRPYIGPKSASRQFPHGCLFTPPSPFHAPLGVEHVGVQRGPHDQLTPSGLAHIFGSTEPSDGRLASFGRIDRIHRDSMAFGGVGPAGRSSAWPLREIRQRHPTWPAMVCVGGLGLRLKRRRPVAGPAGIPGRGAQTDQSSTLRPGTRPKSRRLRVTTTA